MPQDEDGLPVPSKEKGTWRTQLCVCVAIATWEHEETASVALLICSLRLGVVRAGQGWLLRVACAEGKM